MVVGFFEGREHHCCGLQFLDSVSSDAVHFPHGSHGIAQQLDVPIVHGEPEGTHRAFDFRRDYHLRRLDPEDVANLGSITEKSK